MKWITSIFLTILLGILLSCKIFAQKADNLVGKWISDNKEAIMEIYKNEDGKFFGKILWLIDDTDSSGNLVKDVRNMNTALHNRTLKGMVFLYGFEFKEGKWLNGKVYNYKNGKEYNAIIWLEHTNILKLKGYNQYIWLGKTITWLRNE